MAFTFIVDATIFITNMRRSVATSVLTKNYIESKISQELIMSKYLDIPIDVIIDCINNNTLIKSVFRDDDNNGSNDAGNGNGNGRYHFALFAIGADTVLLQGVQCARKLQVGNIAGNKA